MTKFFSMRRLHIVLAGLAISTMALLVHADIAQNTYDANGRLSTVTSANWTTTYSYDLAGNVTNIARTSTVFSLVAITSRRIHGSAGTFELPINKSIPISGTVSVESRRIGAGHLIVFQFNSPITNPGTAIAYDKLGAQIGSATTTGSGNEVRVTLTGTLNTKRVRIDVSGVNGSATVHQVALGFLEGDVNGGGSVNAGDISTVRARSGQVTNATNFASDIDVSGAITSADILAVQGQSGQVLEAP